MGCPGSEKLAIRHCRQGLTRKVSRPKQRRQRHIQESLIPEKQKPPRAGQSPTRLRASGGILDKVTRTNLAGEVRFEAKDVWLTGSACGNPSSAHLLLLKLGFL